MRGAELGGAKVCRELSIGCAAGPVAALCATGCLRFSHQTVTAAGAVCCAQLRAQHVKWSFVINVCACSFAAAIAIRGFRVLQARNYTRTHVLYMIVNAWR